MFPPVVINRVNAIKNIMAQQLQIEYKQTAELAELERRYQSIFEPFYRRRAEIISGVYEPTVEDCYNPSDAEEDIELFTRRHILPTSGSGLKKGIPNFWLTVLQSCPPLNALIEEHDQEVLQFLEDIRSEMLEFNENVGGYKLIFVFRKNKFFSNKELCKTYYYAKNGNFLNAEVFERAESSTIYWFKDMDLSVVLTKKKQRHKTTGKTRVFIKKEERPTFFTFFRPFKAASVEECSESEEAPFAIEQDINVAELLRTTIIPYAVLCYTGELNMDDLYSDDIPSEEEKSEELDSLLT
ncbi:nucleosome assembly protein 1-like 1-B [Zophobas morio]|jgi:nucleosome assembly protein 1-like 1|uniref:nucleosome assembly protein 1-like 1-B n=1 Tax=Zophobas morio TaxID=2755281 RepID=UPI003082EAC2